MLPTTRLDIKVVNPHLTCVLCGGYFIDATTITECLHSFCKKCILVYLESSKCCPICDTQVHQTKSLLNLRPDKTLQDIVYKLVPGLYRTEMKQRREFYSTHSEQDPVSREDGGDVRDRMVYAANHKISVCLKYMGTTSSNSSKKDHNQTNSVADLYKQRYLLCPAAFSITHLYKFIRLKFELSEDYKIDILHSDEILHEEMTLADVAYTFGWEEVEPLLLWYRIQDKKIKKANPLSRERLSSHCDTALPERHIVTSSGRRVKQIYDIETKLILPPARAVKKRKASGGSTAGCKGSKKSKSEHSKYEMSDLTPSKVHKDLFETNASVKSKSKSDKADKQRKERNIFDVISDKNSSDYEPEVPHIAIKISKTGDTKDAWCSQPCQISNHHRTTSKQKQTIETKEHHRKEFEEDSGRGSDVSSPSLLSPSSTDPSMSPPAPVQMISPSQDASSHHHRRVQDKSSTSPKSSTIEHSSLKTRTKSLSSSHNVSPKSHDDSHDSGSSSLPNSPCHSTVSKDDVVTESPKVDKPHKKRSHKYNSLTIKVPDHSSNRCDLSTNNLTNGHYSSVIASIPSPENPLLMKITRQISTKPNICQSDNHDRINSSSSLTRNSPPPPPPSPSSPLNQKSPSLKSSKSSSATSEKPPEQISIPPPKSLAKCDKEQNVIESVPEEVVERTLTPSSDDKNTSSADNEKAISDASVSTTSKSSVQICQDKFPSAVDNSQEKEVSTTSKSNAQICQVKSLSVEKNKEKDSTKIHKPVKLPNPAISDQPEDKDNPINSTCSRVKPYVNKTKTSTATSKETAIVSLLPTTTTTTTTTHVKNINLNKQSNHESSKRPRIIPCPAVSMPPMIPSPGIHHSIRNHQPLVTTSSTFSLPMQGSIDHHLRALPGLKIPHFIPKAAWYNLPRNSPPTSTVQGSTMGHMGNYMRQYDSPQRDDDREKESPQEIRHKTPQQVKRPIMSQHHIMPQPMLIRAMRRPPMSVGPPMPELWRIPSYPPFSTPPNLK